MRLSRTLAIACLASACGHPAQRPAAGPTVHVAPRPTPPAATTAAGQIVDQGVFAIQLAGVDAGEEHFTITRGDGWTFDSTFQVATSQIRVDSKNQIVTDAAFRPRRASIVGTTNGVGFTEKLTPGPPLTLDIDEGGNKRSLTAPGNVDALLADNSVVHMTVFCRRDAKAATVVVFPGLDTTVSASAPAGTDGKLIRRAVQAAGQAAVEIYCDGDRLIAVDAPAVSMSAVRRGEEVRYAAVQARPRVKPALPDGLVELERNVDVKAQKGVDAATLACSLVMPASMRDTAHRPAKGALPAVLLLGEHFPSDRDGDTIGAGGVKLSFEKTLAIELGQAGIATLRCDGRGTGASSGEFLKSTFETFVADAVAATTSLRGEPAIDPKRVGVVGHGQGGEVAVQVAADLAWVRALVVAGAPGRTLDLVLLDQDDRAMARGGATEDQRKTTRDLETAISAAIKTGAPLPPNTQNAPQIEQSRAWLASEFAHDPAATAARVKKIAVLVAHADQDQQMTIKDSELLRDALVKGGNRGVEYHLYAGLNHWFAPSITGDLTDLVDPEAKVAPRFLEDLVGFCRKQL